MLLSLKKKITPGIFVFCANIVLGQGVSNVLGQNLSSNTNVITTGVPFLLISPDARANGMGNTGAASSPDANSIFWNPAKLAFIKDTAGLSASYLPWLRQLVPAINLYYLSAFYKLNSNQALGISFRYFSEDNIEYTNGSMSNPSNPNQPVSISNSTPYEYALDICYSRKLSENWSAGMTARYIYSNLLGTSNIAGQYVYPGRAFGVDFSAYHKGGEIHFFKYLSTLSEGICISNIGNKISYSNSGYSIVQPTNLKLGICYTIQFDSLNKLSLLEDANKVLVQPPIAISTTNDELHYVTWSTGMEYTYNNHFAARTGYFYENPVAGGREYYTMGVGLRLAVLHIDASYLIPVSQQSPLQNTIVISLGIYISQKKPKAVSLPTWNRVI
jgi:hypothetical protein